MYVCVCVCVCVCIYVYMCVSLYTYTHKYIYIYIYTHVGLAYARVGDADRADLAYQEGMRIAKVHAVCVCVCVCIYACIQNNLLAPKGIALCMHA